MNKIRISDLIIWLIVIILIVLGIYVLISGVK